MSRLAAPGGRVEEISRPEAVPEYLWQGCKAETYGREKKLKDEIIRRVMTFRGKGSPTLSPFPPVLENIHGNG